MLCCEIWGGSGGGGRAAAARVSVRQPPATKSLAEAAEVNKANDQAEVDGKVATEGEGAAAEVAAGGAAGGDGDGAKGPGQGRGQGQAVWVCLAPADLPALHGRLPYWCHSETLRVMRPLGERLRAEGAVAAGDTCLPYCTLPYPTVPYRTLEASRIRRPRPRGP